MLPNSESSPLSGAPPAAAMVLLVDDQVMVGEAIRRALSTASNIDFHFCPDPQDALATAVATRPTVILQDLVLPGVNGLTLVQAYRAHPVTRDIPIIVLSTKEDASVKSAAFAAGANDYLVKLPDTIELIARIRYHSRSYLALVQRDEAYHALRQSQQQLLESNLELRRLMNSDGLTGLGNRRYFDEYLGAEWDRAVRQGLELSVLMVDVDNFKAYNDCYGHIPGDEALKRVAGAILSACNRPTDLAARFGGEEFSVILPAMPAGGARLVAEKLRRSVEAMQIPHADSATGAWLTVSVGVASGIPQAGGKFSDLIEIADRSLYQAKRHGRNQVVMGEPLHPV